MDFRRRSLLLFSLFIGLLVFSTASRAMDIAIALSQASGPHREFYDALFASRTTLPHHLKDAGNSESGLNGSVLQEADIVIAVGARATQEILANMRKPVLAALVSRSQYQSLSKSYPAANLSAMVLDHPASRHMRLASNVAPNIRQVGLLVGPDSRDLELGFSTAAVESGIKLMSRRVGNVDELLPQLEQLLQAGDALLMIPDPLIASQASARTILLTSYRYRKPIIAYSRAYVQAGALAAVFSTPEDAALDLADWLRTAGSSALRQSIEIVPTRFSVTVNRQVARSLGLDVPSDDELATRILTAVKR